MKTEANANYSKLFPSGICRMGDTDVTYYRTANRLWFDKKAIEFVLTGKNQHNLLGQYKDPKNHSKIFDGERKELIEVINVTGVKNYLQKAWSVCDENRRAFYNGLKTLDRKPSERVAEPLQMPIFPEQTEKVKEFVKIQKDDNGEFDIAFTVSGESTDEKKRNIVNMLLSVANQLANGDVNFA